MTALSTIQFQQQIDACAASGGGQVVIPSGLHLIGTLVLRSGVHLYLDAGAQLIGSHSLSDYRDDLIGCIEAPAFNRCLIYAADAEDLSISGPGTINGRGHREVFRPSGDPAHVPERPMLIRMVRCRNVRFEQVTLRDAAAWCSHLVGCEQVRILGVTLESHCNTNNDGFDLDGCRDVMIRDCFITTGDDAICLKSTQGHACENVIVTGCIISSQTAGIKLGTSSAIGFRNVLVQHSIFRHCRMGVLKLLCVDGGVMEEIHFSDLLMDDVEGPIFIRLGARGVCFDQPKEIVYDQEEVKTTEPIVGKLRNCTFRNLRATIATNDRTRHGIFVTGIPGHCVESLVFENITLTLPGGGTAEEAARTLPEDERRYPEQFFFGPLPASALYLRHVRGIELRQVQITLKAPDARPPLQVTDVEECALHDVQWRDTSGRGFCPVTL